jgi:riboflavin kinase/FMN adenylyltransferase
MQIFHGHRPRPSPSTALTIGNFDGVHLGHQALLQQLRDAAAARELQSAVVVFEPHPREFFAPQQAPARLTDLRGKLERFAALKLDRVYVCRFDAQFAQMAAATFARLLPAATGARFVLVGDDFRFGRGREGDFALLERVGREAGFETQAMHSVTRDGERISSTAVRAALAAGDVATAQAALGVPYSISGRVIHGDGLGRGLGFPTANIQLKHERLPMQGVYVTRVQMDGMDALQGAASLGVRPTVRDNAKPTLEVHLLNFDRQIYGRRLRVEFLHKLRDEMKFSGLDSLKQQIALDVAQTKMWFIGQQENPS